MKHRMYIDEVGNSDLGFSEDPNHRYLSLTGVITGLDYVRTTLAPALEALKTTHFEDHPDERVILHRKELVNKRRPFEALRVPGIEAAFNADLLRLLAELDYAVLAVVIDKQEHKERYQIWRHDPYHYCLAVLVERYVMWLRHRAFTGDVMAESRGGKEDRRLKESFRHLYEHGSDYISAEQLGSSLTSGELKIKPKANNIAGLQLADLIAHPIYKAMLSRRAGTPGPRTFGSQVFRILEHTKLDRSKANALEGWGLKWLP